MSWSMEKYRTKFGVCCANMTNHISRTKRKMSYKMLGKLLLRSSILLKTVYNFLYIYTSCRRKHCVKSVRIRSFSGPYFPAFGLSTERYVVYGIQSECGKIRTRKSPNKDTFHAVKRSSYWLMLFKYFNTFKLLSNSVKCP